MISLVFFFVLSFRLFFLIYIAWGLFHVYVMNSYVMDSWGLTDNDGGLGLLVHSGCDRLNHLHERTAVPMATTTKI